MSEQTHERLGRSTSERLLALGAGLLFGVGLVVSGMTDPHKVLSFLDVTGSWDPSLALVMAGAIAVGLVTFRVAARRSASWIGTPMQLPKRRDIDAPLVVGAALFGIGWGLVGLCPGPAFVSLASGQMDVFLVVVGILGGAALVDLLRLAAPPKPEVPPR